MAAINAQMGNGSVVGTDRRAPTIGPVGISVSASSATIAWNTDENSSALVYYSLSPIGFTEAGSGSSVTVSGTGAIANLDLQSSHSVTITGLTANTTYNYIAYVKDASGNETVTSPSSFHTSN
jgi:chitodextrinase